MWNLFRKKKQRPVVTVLVILERPHHDCRIWLKADGHESDIAVALLLAMDLDNSFAKVVRQAVTLYLDPEREITEFKK